MYIPNDDTQNYHYWGSFRYRTEVHLYQFIHQYLQATTGRISHTKISIFSSLPISIPEKTMYLLAF